MVKYLRIKSPDGLGADGILVNIAGLSHVAIEGTLFRTSLVYDSGCALRLHHGNDWGQEFDSNAGGAAAEGTDASNYVVAVDNAFDDSYIGKSLFNKTVGGFIGFSKITGIASTDIGETTYTDNTLVLESPITGQTDGDTANVVYTGTAMNVFKALNDAITEINSKKAQNAVVDVMLGENFGKTSAVWG